MLACLGAAVHSVGSACFMLIDEATAVKQSKFDTCNKHSYVEKVNL